MGRNIILLSVTYASLFAVPNHITMPPDTEVTTNYVIPYTGHRQSPGIEVGMTDYDWQANGSMGRYVWATPSGGYSFYWTYCFGGSNPNRRAFYNYFDPPSYWLGPTAIDTDYSRMGSMDQMTDGRAVATAHISITNEVLPRVYVDSTEGAGVFTAIDIPFPDESSVPIWPKPCVDDSDNIYVIASQNTGPYSWWTMSTDGGQTWAAWNNSLGGVMLSTQYYVSGGREVWTEHNDKIALVNTMNDDHYTIVYWESSGQSDSWYYDTVYCLTTSPGDSVYGYFWNSAVYDNDGYLHVVFTVIDTMPNGGGNLGSGWRSQIRHWNQQTRQISFVDYGLGWATSNPGPGANHPTVSEPQIAIDRATGDLYCSWCYADSTDVAANGLVNMDIWGARSTDNGATWFGQHNITYSPSPGAAAGYCDNDHMNHLAEETLGDTMIMFYLNDKDAGNAAYPPDPGATYTDSPLLFYRHGLCEDTKEYNKNGALKCSLHAAPNPAANRSTVNYTMPISGHYVLKLYDVGGRLVATIDEGSKPSGRHVADLDFVGLPNGTYFVVFETNTTKLSVPLVLIR
jgi:hypothetical protein